MKKLRIGFTLAAFANVGPITVSSASERNIAKVLLRQLQSTRKVVLDPGQSNVGKDEENKREEAAANELFVYTKNAFKGPYADCDCNAALQIRLGVILRLTVSLWVEAMNAVS